MRKKEMWKKFGIFIWFLFITLTIIACENRNKENQTPPIMVDEDDFKDDFFKDVEIKQKVVFIVRHVNHSEGYQDYGIFVDNQGNEVEFDLSEDVSDVDSRSKDFNFLDYLENIQYEESDDSSQIDLLELKRYYSYLYKVDLNAKMESIDERVYDYGQESLIGIVYDEENNPNFITLGSIGDYRYVNTDIYAKRIADWWGLFKRWDDWKNP